MVLVETSVLISYLRNIHTPKTDKFQNILDADTSWVICGIIYQELLQGASDLKEYEQLKDYFGTQRFYKLKNSHDSHERAALLYLNCRKKGLTIRKTLYLNIAQIAIDNKLLLLHDDKDFDHIRQANSDLKIY